MTKKKKKPVDKSIVCTAIIGLVILECLALYTGHNGTILKFIIAIVAGLGGWSLPRPNIK